jgi:hypothetical protein
MWILLLIVGVLVLGLLAALLLARRTRRRRREPGRGGRTVLIPEGWAPEADALPSAEPPETEAGPGDVPAPAQVDVDDTPVVGTADGSPAPLADLPWSDEDEPWSDEKVGSVAAGTRRPLEGRRIRAPFAPTLTDRLAGPAQDDLTPGELLADFERTPPAGAAEHFVQALARSGYTVRWRRQEEIALGSQDGRVARIVIRPEGEVHTTVGVELDPAEVADVAVELVASIEDAGYRVDRRDPSGLVLLGPDDDRVTVGRTRAASRAS